MNKGNNKEDIRIFMESVEQLEVIEKVMSAVVISK